MPVRIAPEELQAALPDLTSTMRLDGLEEPVEVFRDPWGIPHLKARTIRRIVEHLLGEMAPEALAGAAGR